MTMIKMEVFVSSAVEEHSLANELDLDLSFVGVTTYHQEPAWKIIKEPAIHGNAKKRWIFVGTISLTNLTLISPVHTTVMFKKYRKMTTEVVMYALKLQRVGSILTMCAVIQIIMDLQWFRVHLNPAEIGLTCVNRVPRGRIVNRATNTANLVNQDIMRMSRKVQAVKFVPKAQYQTLLEAPQLVNLVVQDLLSALAKARSLVFANQATIMIMHQ
jgi:hypothetical protein